MTKMYKMQLSEVGTNRSIFHDGYAIVMANGSPSKLALTDATGAALTNPVAIVNGEIEFYTADSVATVDISVYTEHGYTAFVQDVLPGTQGEIYIDLKNQYQTVILPFDIDDTDVTANTEYDTGVNAAVGAILLPQGAGVKVTTIDAGMTIDFGMDGAGAENDPDGLFNGVSLAALGFTAAQIGFTVGTNNVTVDLTGGDAEFTYGVLFSAAGDLSAKVEGGDAASTNGNGFGYLKGHEVAAASANFTYTLSASTDTGAGYIIQPQFIPFPASYR